MDSAINTILANIGNNPEAMKALMAAISEAGKIASEEKTEEVKKTCRYVICLERETVHGDKVYHPFVMTPPTAEDPKMLIVDNAVEAQNVAQVYGMRIHDNVYAMPATEEQIVELTRLLKKCNKNIVDAVNKAARAVGLVSNNIDIDALCSQYMQLMMQNCHCVIGSSLTGDSEIIKEDVKVIHPVHDNDDCCDCSDCDCEDWEDEDDCYCCGNDCCPNHPDNQ
jgi:hypothetical protein